MSETGTGTTRRRRRRASVGHERILDAACDVVAERGYENTRLSDVAERAGTSISTLQYLFGSRDDLIVAAVESRTASFLDEARRRSTAIADPLARLAWVAAHLVASDGTEEDAKHDWMVWAEYWRAALRDEGLREASVATYDGWRALVKDAVTACVEAKVVPAPRDLDLVVDGVCALADGLGIQIALGHATTTWKRAGEIVRSWLATQLGCPELAAVGR